MKICAVFCVFVALALGSPVPPNTQQCECSAAARSLLSSLSHIMQKEGKMEHRDLFAGFNCTDLEAQMIPHTLTASVCQPSGSAHNASCSSHRRSSFSETECLRNIRADLSYYDVMLSSYRPSETDLSPVKTATKGLMNCLNENCEAADGEFPQWRVWSGLSFDDRLSLCKTLKGFHIRAITVNRALGYIGSGEHRK
ncbi:interleukin-12 subunit alpha [Sinocyclocheilus anshuiensis]|uniref:interleukin-12 subunit alpha n=1 Tax=Sinocyclocheilus anshuiensis TaxID=1608454 RepID=UPI0007B7A706|nr:PREDICTED: interleukin-12 subunit alpha-like [Sinocyclocheilus anshuiensis]